MKLAFIILCVLAGIGLFTLLGKIISGTVVFITGAFNALLGIVVVTALILIVAWMFSYAKKHR